MRVGGHRITLTVIIPVYNNAATIQRTLDSLNVIVPANRPDVQVIVVNDGSTDNSVALIRAACHQVSGFAWELLDKSNGGPSSARNAALTKAQGDWILFLDADDELQTDPLSFISAAGDHTCIGFTLEYRRHLQPWRHVQPPLIGLWNWLDVLSARCPYQPSSLVCRRDCIEHPFDEEIHYAEDWLFWLQNPGLFRNMQTWPGVTLATIHIHDANASSNYREWGCDRIKVAGRAVQFHGHRLTQKQRNNLRLQGRIGLLQQGCLIPLTTFLIIPCDPLLYVKLWLYALSALLAWQVTPYRSARQSDSRAGSAEQAGPTT